MVDTHQAVRGSTPLWYQGGDLGLSSRDSARRARGKKETRDASRCAGTKESRSETESRDEGSKVSQFF